MIIQTLQNPDALLQTLQEHAEKLQYSEAAQADRQADRLAETLYHARQSLGSPSGPARGVSNLPRHVKMYPKAISRDS